MICQAPNAAIIFINETIAVKISLTTEDDFVHNIGVNFSLFNDLTRKFFCYSQVSPETASRVQDNHLRSLRQSAMLTRTAMFVSERLLQALVVCFAWTVE